MDKQTEQRLVTQITNQVNVLLKASNGDGKLLYRAIVLAERYAASIGEPLNDGLILAHMDAARNVTIFPEKIKHVR